MSSEGDIMPPHFFAKGQNVNKEVYLDVMQTVVKPWRPRLLLVDLISTSKMELPPTLQFGAKNWCLENLDRFWSEQS
ncbi:Transposable element tcb1 transposase [Caligus rogercresseyi]|uniref:Transposable element tcb1 transposase n=1 Tax=Caligus rogercresseyi TaxID=217165 RepID=A0A7T8GTV3_CALRO|nr:Transposable element tcb1 transposase [Caligus rogercresseyi]